MTTILTQFITAVLPLILWILRIGMAFLALAIVIRCCRSLFGGHSEPEVWGFMTLANGARYDLHHWENMIGRSRSADIRINFPSVSRTHASICRDESGEWRVYPINTTSGILLNKEYLQASAPLHAGDTLTVGGVDLFFFPSTEDDEAIQSQTRTRPGKYISPTGTLWMLTLFQILTYAQFLLSVDEETWLPVSVGFIGLAALCWCFYIFYRILHRTGYELETMIFLLTTIGFAVTAAFDPDSLYKQLIAVAIGMALFLTMSLVMRSLRLSLSLRWPLAAAASALLAFNVLFGEVIFGAKNWVQIGPISFQPSEFVKIAFILAGATTLDRLFTRRNLIFTLLFSAFCVGCLALMSDFGTALIFFVAFLCIAFLRTGDASSVVMMTAAAGFAGAIVLRFKPYVADRFSVWLHAWEYTQTTGYQQTRTMSAAASGGLFGVGPESGWLKYIGAANTDLVFGVVGEEFGLLLALLCVAIVVIIALYALQCAQSARSTFYTIASCSTAAMLVFQVCLNVLGAVDLLPLTGVTFPFVSMGGSSMISCWGLAAFLKAADTRQNATMAQKLPRNKKKKRKKASPPVPPEPAQETFFDEIPDIPLDDIFGKDGDNQ